MKITKMLKLLTMERRVKECQRRIWEEKGGKEQDGTWKNRRKKGVIFTKAHFASDYVRVFATFIILQIVVTLFFYPSAV